MKITVLLAALCAVLFASQADARPRHHSHHIARSGDMMGLYVTGCSDPVMRPCYRGGEALSGRDKVALKRGGSRGKVAPARRESEVAMPPGLRRVMAEGAGRVVGGRPAGCPRRYCGCGASLYLFGKIVPRLNLAANWLRFPRAEPAPGMVAARRGHVFVLVRHISGKVWLAHDSNSGRHRTRVHPRSIAGYVVVNPRGASL